jgi:uncharacterized protein (DUF58 family)
MKSSVVLRWLLPGLVVIGVGVWLTTGSATFIRIAYIALFLFLGAGLWSGLLTRGIQVKRDARLLRASVGEIFDERFEVQVDSWPGCPWIEIINQSPLAEAAGSKLLTRIGWREKRMYTARTLLTARGAFPLGPTMIATGDPFGIFPIEKTFPAAETLLVFPKIYSIQEFPPPPGLLPGGKATRIKTMDVTPHAAGIRDYIPGDPMKRIHWPATAHRGHFMVKEFEQDPQSEIWILVDAQRDVHYRQVTENHPHGEEIFILRKQKINLPCDTFEYALSAAGSLAQHFLRNHRSVGLACSSSMFNLRTSERGERQVGKILEALSLVQADGDISASELINRQAKQFPLGTGVILITPSDNPELLFSMERLLRRNLRPVVVMLSAKTFSPQASDSTDLVSSLLSMNIPICQIAYGDDLSTKLSIPVVYFQHAYMPKSYLSTRA